MAWNDVNIQFGNTVRRIREGRKMSQEEFAGMCGISRAYQKISEATGLSFSELFEDII